MRDRWFLGQFPAPILCEIKEKGFVSPNAAEALQWSFGCNPVSTPEGVGSAHNLTGGWVGGGGGGCGGVGMGPVEALNSLSPTWGLGLSRGTYCFLNQGPGRRGLSK